MRVSLSSLAILLALGACGCGDRMAAHLEKFRPLQSDGGTTAQPPDVYALAESAEVADRIGSLTFQEVASRLGAHRFKAHTEIEFRTGSDRLALKEDALLVQAANGDFRAVVENDNGQGFELLKSGSDFFVRNRFGPFHPRLALDGETIGWREMPYGAWGAVYRLFRGRLRFTKVGLARHFGRDGLQFAIALAAGAPPRAPGTPAVPAVPAGVSDYVYPIDETPSERDRWRDLAQPVSAKGSLIVDLDSGAVLKADLQGAFGWSGPDGQPASLAVSLQATADGFGNPPSLAPPPPEQIQPAPARIPVDTRPLDFAFGKGFTATLGPPAGVAAARSKEPEAEPATAPPLEGGPE